MNEQLQQALSDLINKSLSGIDQTTDFLSAEIPDVITQLLLWHGIYNFILFIIGILLLLCIVYSNYKQVKWIKKEDIDIDPEIVVPNIFQIFFIFPLAYFLNLQWLKIWIAPKVWLIDYAKSLVIS